MAEPRVLAVEDDPPMQRLLQTQLAARGFRVQVVGSGPEALDATADEEPDIILLDLGLPDMSGMEVCRQLREWSRVPIIMVTAADAPRTKMEALDLGADDFITKPFHMGEVVSRIRAVLRRAAGSVVPADAVIEAAGLRLDLRARRVWRDDAEIALSKTEYDLLQTLASQPDRVLTYQHLLETVWGPGYDDVRSVHVQICHLRRKIEHGPDDRRYIVAVPRVGYRFSLREE